MLIAQISDMHVKPPGELLYKRIDTPGFLERAVAHVMPLDPRPDLVLATGDLVDGGKPEEYALLRRLLAPLADAGLSDPRQPRCARRHARGLRRSRLPAQERLPPIRDRGPAGAPDRARHAGAGQGHGALCDERLDWLEARFGESDRPTCSSCIIRRSTAASMLSTA